MTLSAFTDSYQWVSATGAHRVLGSKPARRSCCCCQSMGHHTNGWICDRYTDPAQCTMRAAPAVTYFTQKYRDSASVLRCCWLGGRKGIKPVKNRVVGCWRGYLSGDRWRLAYGPADATATHYLLLQ